MFLFDSQIVIGLCVLICSLALLAPFFKTVAIRIWKGPESQIYAVWIPTDDPINNRCEIFCSKDP